MAKKTVRDKTKAEDFTNIGHLVDLKDGQKNKQKKSSTIKHFSYFLRNQNTFDKIKVLSDIKSMSDITDELVGEFATYLGKYARSYCDVNKPLLKYLTAHGYLSAFKMHYEGLFRNQESPLCFHPTKWSSFLRSIYKEKAQQARDGGYVSPIESEKMLYQVLSNTKFWRSI